MILLTRKLRRGASVVSPHALWMAAAASGDVCTLAAEAARFAKDGRSEEALQVLDRLLEVDPSSALWPSMRARLLLDAGDALGAAAAAESALTLEASQPEALAVKARALAVLAASALPADVAAARAAAERALSAPQLSAKLRGEVEAALATLPVGSSHDDTAPATTAASGRATATRGCSAQTLEACTVASRAADAWRSQRSDEAEALLAELCTMDPDCLLWPCLLARLHLAAGDADKALAACARAPGMLRLSIAAAELLVLRGRARLQVGDAAAAKADLMRAVAVRGGLSPGVHHEFVEALKQIGEELPAAGPLPSGVDPRNLQSPGSVMVAGSSPAASSTAAVAITTAPSTAAAAPRQAPASAVSTPAPQKDTKAIAAELTAAKNAEKQGNFAVAKKHCQEALKLDPSAYTAVLLLARLELEAGRWKDTTKLLREQYPAILKSNPHSPEAYSLLARAAEEAGDWDQACVELERGMRVASNSSSGGNGDLLSRQEFMGRLARARWHSGDRDIAADAAQRVLDECQTQLEASEIACVLLMDRGDSATALAVMLRTLIAHRQKPSSACAGLVCGVMRRCSVEELLHVLNPNQDGSADNASSVAEVVAYVGLIMKEQSEVVEACRLYRAAALLAPLHASLCLNMMHCYFLRRDSIRALAWGLRFMSLIAAKKGTAPAAAAQAICAALRGSGGAADESSGPRFAIDQFESKSNFYDVIAIGFVLVKILFLLCPYVSAATSAGSAEEPPWRQRLMAVGIEKEPAGGSVDRLDAQMEPKHVEAHRNTLRRLCNVLDRSRGDHDLHLTPVRNEHAYYLCISDLLKLVAEDPKIVEITDEQPSVAPADGKPLFVIGDSHVLSSAWQTVTLPAGEDGSPNSRLLVPCLVTGAKLWHLRKSSSFYTKFAFWNRVTALPPGADAVLVLGEIDCREGIIGAVQKGKHASIEAALISVVQLYLDLVREVRKRVPRLGKLFIHPVPHVLPETRFLTMAFNRVLGSQEVTAALGEAGACVLSMPPVFEGAEPSAESSPQDLTKLTLLPELQLDGTHMSSRYVASHLEPALIDAW